MLQYFESPPQSQWEELCKRPLQALDKARLAAEEVIKAIRADGDRAAIELTERFDGVRLSELLVSEKEFEEAQNVVTAELKGAIQAAYENIISFHKLQLGRREYEVKPSSNIRLWRKESAISKVGLYVPGGTAPLFSTVLMLGLPAKLAGCKEVVLCSPPQRDGRIPAAILYAAKLCGITKVYKLGGAQAIAAMAYGTESVPRVFKILGPGNLYVTAAKQIISADSEIVCAIDMPAGPTEVLVYADSTADKRFVAADLIAQAEHGVDSQVMLVSTDQSLLAEVEGELLSQLENLPRAEIAKEALKNSKALYFTNETECLSFTNEYAPEHLILLSDRAREISEQIEAAGSVFVGHLTPESLGDYASGTNHTLPTNAAAKCYSGVSVESFQNTITFQQVNAEGLAELAETVQVMAREELLEGHARAVSIRVRNTLGQGGK